MARASRRGIDLSIATPAVVVRAGPAAYPPSRTPSLAWAGPGTGGTITAAGLLMVPPSWEQQEGGQLPLTACQAVKLGSGLASASSQQGSAGAKSGPLPHPLSAAVAAAMSRPPPSSVAAAAAEAAAELMPAGDEGSSKPAGTEPLTCHPERAPQLPAVEQRGAAGVFQVTEQLGRRERRSTAEGTVAARLAAEPLPATACAAAAPVGPEPHAPLVSRQLCSVFKAAHSGLLFAAFGNSPCVSC
jgi:hypothetical protein